jgi:hypothetical protein
MVFAMVRSQVKISLQKADIRNSLESRPLERRKES